MVNIETYGKPTNAENTAIDNARKDAEKLVRELTQMVGIMKKSQFQDHITDCVTFINSLQAFKVDLEAMNDDLLAAP